MLSDTRTTQAFHNEATFIIIYWLLNVPRLYLYRVVKKKVYPFLLKYFTPLKLKLYSYFCTSLNRWWLRLCGEKFNEFQYLFNKLWYVEYFLPKTSLSTSNTTHVKAMGERARRCLADQGLNVEDRHWITVTLDLITSGFRPVYCRFII